MDKSEFHASNAPLFVEREYLIDVRFKSPVVDVKEYTDIALPGIGNYRLEVEVLSGVSARINVDRGCVGP